MKITNPKLRFKDDNGNDFPDWETKKLSEVCDDIMYGMNAAAKEFDGINKYLRITDIDDCSRQFMPKPLVSPDGDINEKYKLQTGDILFTRTGASVGKSYLYNPKDGNLLFAGFLIKFSIKNENPYFIFSQTLLEKYDNWVEKMSMRSGQPGLNAEEYKSLVISLTNLAEQTKIANFLSAIDEKINLLKQKHRLLTQYKKGLMQKLFSQQLRFKDDNGNDFPDWQTKKLGEVAEINMGQSPDSNSYNINNYGYPLIQGNADIKNRVSAPKSWTSKPTKMCNIGDILLTVRAPVGTVAKSLHNACIGRGVCSIRSNDFSDISFLYQFLLGNENKWAKLEQGSTFTAVNSSDIKSLNIQIPTLAEQTKIANFLTTIDEKINLTAKLIKQNELYKKGLMQQMFV